MQPSIRVALTKWSHTEPERGFEPWSAGYKATALPFELSFIDFFPSFFLSFFLSNICLFLSFFLYKICIFSFFLPFFLTHGPFLHLFLSPFNAHPIFTRKHYPPLINTHTHTLFLWHTHIHSSTYFLIFRSTLCPPSTPFPQIFCRPYFSFLSSVHSIECVKSVVLDCSTLKIMW